MEGITCHKLKYTKSIHNNTKSILNNHMKLFFNVFGNVESLINKHNFQSSIKPIITPQRYTPPHPSHTSLPHKDYQTNMMYHLL